MSDHQYDQTAGEPREPRDIVVVMTDQHRADLTAREGFPVDCTPTLDRLARGGRWFDRAYTSAPLCVPARISMLTGRFPSVHGIHRNAGYDAPDYETDLVDVVSAAGFRTALVGKNHSHLTPDRLDRWVEFGHLGRQPPDEATGTHRAFDDWLRANPGTSLAPTPFPVDAQVCARAVDEAIRWLDTARHGDRSFLWLSLPEPHVPYQVPEPYFSTYAPDRIPPAATSLAELDGRDIAWRYAGRLARLSGEAEPVVLERARANYIGMLRLLDDQVARLVDHLQSRGSLRHTLVVFVSDHGDFAGEYGLMRKGPGLPDVLTRVPLFFHGPGVVTDAEPSTAHVSITDLLPTVCELVGQPIPAGVQGRSLVPLLRGERVDGAFSSAYAEQGVGGPPFDESNLGDTEPGVRRRPDGQVVVDMVNPVTQNGARRMLRSGRWKLVADSTGALALYDLATDPYECDNLSGDPTYAPRLCDLLAQLTSWMLRTAHADPAPHG